jgi:hypothetical protein
MGATRSTKRTRGTTTRRMFRRLRPRSRCLGPQVRAHLFFALHDRPRAFVVFLDRHWGPALAASLPISIGPNRVRTASGGLTYQPKASLSDAYGQLAPALRGGAAQSPAALRKAAYAERDRARSMDPGALDFLVHEDEDEDGEDGPGAGSRGRESALRILQARSELPAEGMWRSLAI